MSLYNEDWNPDDYLTHGHRITRKLTKNNLTVATGVPATFVDYHANENVPCLIYERSLTACYNTLGFNTPEFYSNKNCMNARNWFGQCVNNMKVTLIWNKYNTETLLKSRDLDPVLRMNQIL